jgi:hypothetical protein
MKSDTKLRVISSRVGNQFFASKNAIEYRYGTLLKFDVQTLWITMQLGFLQKGKFS